MPKYFHCDVESGQTFLSRSRENQQTPSAVAIICILLSRPSAPSAALDSPIAMACSRLLTGVRARPLCRVVLVMAADGFLGFLAVSSGHKIKIDSSISIIHLGAPCQAQGTIYTVPFSHQPQPIRFENFGGFTSSDHMAFGILWRQSPCGRIRRPHQSLTLFNNGRHQVATVCVTRIAPVEKPQFFFSDNRTRPVTTAIRFAREVWSQNRRSFVIAPMSSRACWPSR